MKKEESKSGDDPFNKKLFFVSKRVLKQFPDEQLLSKKPNNNTLFEDAMAILVMNTIYLYTFLKNTKNNLLVAGIVVRAELELFANINYLIKNRNSEKLIESFLSTANVVPTKINDFLSDKVSKGVKWTDVPMTERIKLINDKKINYLAVWHYYSSFAHGDCGHIGTLSYEGNSMHNITLSFGCIIFLDIVKSLEKAGVVKGDYDKIIY